MMSNPKHLSIRITQNKFYGRKVGKQYYKSLKQQLEHDFRLEDMDEGYLENPEYAGNNVFYGGKGDDPKEWVEYIVGRAETNWLRSQLDYKNHWGQSMHKKTNEVITGLFNYSENFNIPKEDIREVVRSLGHFIKKKFGNVLHVAFHADEHGDDQAGHFHFSMLNYDIRTHKTTARNICPFKLQDEIQEHLEKDGLAFGHVRGVPKESKKGNKEHLQVAQLQKLRLFKQKKQIQELNQEVYQLTNTVNNMKTDIDTMTRELYLYANDLILLGADEEKIKRKLQTGMKYAQSGKTYKLAKILEKWSVLSEQLKTSPIPQEPSPFEPPSPFSRK